MDKFLFTSSLSDIQTVFGIKSIDQNKVYKVSVFLSAEFLKIIAMKKEAPKPTPQPNHSHHHHHHHQHQHQHKQQPEAPKKPQMPQMPQMGPSMDLKLMISEAMKSGQEALNEVLDSKAGMPIVSQDNKSVKKRINIGSSTVSDLY